MYIVSTPKVQTRLSGRWVCVNLTDPFRYHFTTAYIEKSSALLNYNLASEFVCRGEQSNSQSHSSELLRERYYGVLPIVSHVLPGAIHCYQWSGVNAEGKLWKTLAPTTLLLQRTRLVYEGHVFPKMN